MCMLVVNDKLLAITLNLFVFIGTFIFFFCVLEVTHLFGSYKSCQKGISISHSEQSRKS